MHISSYGRGYGVGGTTSNTTHHYGEVCFRIGARKLFSIFDWNFSQCLCLTLHKNQTKQNKMELKKTSKNWYYLFMKSPSFISFICFCCFWLGHKKRKQVAIVANSHTTKSTHRQNEMPLEVTPASAQTQCKHRRRRKEKKKYPFPTIAAHSIFVAFVR